METLNRQENPFNSFLVSQFQEKCQEWEKIKIINLKKTRYAYSIYLTLRDSLDAGVAVAESDLGVLYSWLNRSWTFALQIQDAWR